MTTSTCSQPASLVRRSSERRTTAVSSPSPQSSRSTWRSGRSACRWSLPGPPYARSAPQPPKSESSAAVPRPRRCRRRRPGVSFPSPPRGGRCRTALEPVVARAARRDVVAAAAVDLVVAQAGVGRVVAGPGADHVGAVAAAHAIVPRQRPDLVAVRRAGEAVVAGRPDDHRCEAVAASARAAALRRRRPVLLPSPKPPSRGASHRLSAAAVKFPWPSRKDQARVLLERPVVDGDAVRGRALVEESREAVVVLDERNVVVAASRRARQSIDGIGEGRPLPDGVLTGERGLVPLVVPYDVEGRRSGSSTSAARVISPPTRSCAPVSPPPSRTSCARRSPGCSRCSRPPRCPGRTSLRSSSRRAARSSRSAS